MFSNTYELHHDPAQWGPDHDTFIPERFDPKSAMSRERKTPRHPMSFLPFAGGKRVCIGKTFAETTFKVVLPLLYKAFNKNGQFGEFVDSKFYTFMPHNNPNQTRPEIFIKLHM